LRSTDRGYLKQRITRGTARNSAFCNAAPVLWNELPDSIPHIKSLERLKTHLFTTAFNLQGSDQFSFFPSFFEGTNFCTIYYLMVGIYVTLKIDSSNALPAGIPSILTSQLQRVKNAAARLVYKSKKHDHITPILTKLHWLPIQDRIIFKIFSPHRQIPQQLGPILSERHPHFLPATPKSPLFIRSSHSRSSKNYTEKV